MELLKLLFVILLIVFTTGEIFRFQIGENVAISLMDIVVCSITLLWVAKLLIQKRFDHFRKSNFAKPIVVFAGGGFISLLIGSVKLNQREFIVSLLYLLRWILFAGIYFTIRDFDSKFKKKILILMIAAGSVVVIVGYLQFFLYSNLRNLYYLGWDDHVYRLFSSFFDPNFAGAILVLNFILLLGVFLSKLKEGRGNKKIIFALLILIILNLPAVFLTFSRSAFIMLIFASSAFFIMINKKKLIFGMAAILIFFILVSSKNFYIENMNLFRIASTTARIESYQNAIKIIKDNFLFGVGFNTYRYAQLRDGFREERGAKISHADAGTDNSFLFVIATTGIIGFISYLYIWFRAMALSFEKYQKREEFEKMLSVVLISSLVGLFVNAMFVNSLFFPSVMLWLWILIGVIENK